MRTPAAAFLAIVAIGAAAAGPETAADLFSRGRKLCDDGNYSAGRDLFAQLIKKFPDAAESAAARDLVAENAFLRTRPLEKNGASESRVDVFVMGEGYTIDSQDNFDNAAKNTVRIF